LSSDCWLRYVAVRRCLSLIERRAVVALQPVVFEPNTPMLWLQVSQLMLDILLPLFESGALRGKRPDEAFTVRCDASVNTPELVEQGMLVCEVGVAIVAPAELIVFRLGRREGVVEVMETPHA
jgi:phage tail sheath protein FI